MWSSYDSLSCTVNQHTRWLLLCISLLWQFQLCSGLSIKSLQVWSQVDSNGDWILPGDSVAADGGITGDSGSMVYSFSIPIVGDAEATEVDGGQSGVGARSAVSRWTSIGCFTSTSQTTPVSVAAVSSGGSIPITSVFNPLLCTDFCAHQADANNVQVMVAVIKETQCYCLPDRSLLTRADDVRCDSPCINYFNSSTKFCGGKGDYYWGYQKYDYVHQTAQGCYDPWRFLWYQSVAIEVVSFVSGVRNASKEFYLHAASLNSGDPVFPYHQQLDSMLMGLQYDLDDSRLVGWVSPTWNQKVDSGSSWNPYLLVFKVRSLYQKVEITKEVIIFPFDGSSAASYLFSNGVTAIDALNNVYYVVFPKVPLIAGQDLRITPRVPQYTTKLYGINIEANSGAVEILDKEIPYNAVLLESNSKYHGLFALLQDDASQRAFYYARLGHSYRNNRTNAVEFNWTFTTPRSSVVNPYSYQGFTDKYYQIGVGSVDHISNLSMVVYKDLPNADTPFYVADIDQRGFLERTIDASMASPSIQGTWLVNADPLIPLTLPAPRLISARFTLDGQGIVVVFDSFTVEGARPIDTDGDLIPDDIDWSTKQEGVRNCSDMFARQTATALGDSRCIWQTATTIQIYVSRTFDGVGVGDGLFLRDSTVYAYLSETQEWSNAASGGIEIRLPDPLPPPTIDVSYPSSVDLCSGVIMNAEKSSGDGGRPIWTWALKKVECTGGRPDTSSITNSIIRTLTDASAHGQTATGVDLVEFGRDDLEPGCKYTINLKLLGRWLKESSKDLILTKREVPAPQVSVTGPRTTHQFRSKKVSLQALVGASQCESQTLLNLRTLKFEWRASVESVDSFSGALGQSAVDLSQLNVQTGSSLIVIPKLSLQPEATYTLTVTVGYEETWDIAEARTEEEVFLSILRSPIKVNILGGSRKVSKATTVAIDTRNSFDPDYPDDLIENNAAWSFSYNCTNQDGAACFPLNAQSSALPDVKDCTSAEGQVFRDLANIYPRPDFTSTVLSTGSYYCRDSTKTGVLILNIESVSAFPLGNYTFTVTAHAHGRTASSAITLQVIGEDMAAPRVLIQPLGQPKISVSQKLRVMGGLMAEDYENFIDSAVFSWSFFKEEANPRYSETAEEGHLNPRIFIRATELTASSFDSFPNSHNLVIKPNQLFASTKYFFRLTATAPHPYGGEPLVGYTDLSVLTAGPAPVPGSLQIFPPAESYVDEEKTLKAEEWNGEDVPLTYMFSYKVGLTAEFPNTIELKADSFNAPTQYVRCFKAGLEEDNYNIQVNVTVISNFGAATWLTQLYKSKPPVDEKTTNNELLALSKQVDAHSSTVILNCINIRNKNITTTAGTGIACGDVPSQDCSSEYSNAKANGNMQAFCNRCESEMGKNAFKHRCPMCCTDCTITTTTTTFEPDAVEDDSEDVEQMVDIMTNTVLSSAATPANAKAKLAIAEDMLRKGHLPRNLGNLLNHLTDQVNSLAESGDEPPEEVDEMLSAVFNTLGQYGLTASGLDNSKDSLNAANPTNEVYFPSNGNATGNGARRLKGPASHRWREQHARSNGLPDWHKLPEAYRDPAYFPQDHIGRGRSLSEHETTATIDEQELLERQWLSFINATDALNAYTEQQAAADDEYFANYSAHLGATERAIATREWWQEKARKEAEKAESIYTQSQVTESMFKHITSVCATLIKQMVTGENQKNFNFPMGNIGIGKTRNLVDSGNTAFHFQDQKWKIDGEETGSYGYEFIQFQKANPLSWDPDSPIGPYLITSLHVFRDDGTAILVDNELQPITIMDDHSTFASATCYMWDWQANNGLGGWSMNGVLNNGRGCVATHLSIVGLFMDVVSPDDGIELPTAVNEDFAKVVSEYNVTVIVSLSVCVVLCSLLHFWGLKQDEQDRTKPMEMMKLGDGITKPRAQDDPVFYSNSPYKQASGTFWNLVRRDHNLVSCFSRCPKMKTSRLQKVSILFATISGTSAICALFYGEHIMNSKHFVEIGIIASVLTYPMIRMMRLMFSSRPYREAQPNQAGIFAVGAPQSDTLQPLQAIPVPEDELDEDGVVPDGGFKGVVSRGGPTSSPIAPIGANEPNPLNGTPNLPNPLNGEPNPLNDAPMSPQRMNLSLPPVQAHSPAVSGGSGPEEGGGPQLPPATAQVLSAQAPVPPPPPAPVSQSDGVPPLPPPAEGPHSEMPSSALMRAVSQKLDEGGDIGNDGPQASARPPMPPITMHHDSHENPLALMPFAPPEESLGLSPILPPATESGALEAAQSSAQVRSYNRVRRMIIEKVCNDAERLAYDERIDMRSSDPTHGNLSTVLAYTSVVSYWVTAMILTVVYSVHLNARDAGRFFYACIFSWLFTWIVLEGVKTILVTILELQQLSQRRRLRDQGSLQRQVAMKKQQKLRQMEAIARVSGAVMPWVPNQPTLSRLPWSSSSVASSVVPAARNFPDGGLDVAPQSFEGILPAPQAQSPSDSQPPSRADESAG